MKIDLRTRCDRCRKIPRGKMNLENWQRYKPFCSYHCQQWGQLEQAAASVGIRIPEICKL